MAKKNILILLLIFVFGLCLRVMFLHQNSLTFGYDQARDAVNALEIARGHLKIFGPPASQPGLFHGVFYYYVLAPFYLFGHGSPVIAAYGIALINCVGILIVFYLSFLMTKKINIALIAAFLFAISFEGVQYATWLSNPTLGIITVPLTYLGLWGWITRKENFWPVICAIGLGLSIQSEIFLVYHIVPVLIWLFISRKNTTKKHLLIFFITVVITLSSMFLAQLKFGLIPTLNGVKELTQGVSQNGNLAYEKSIGDYLILYLNQVGRIFSFNSYPGNVGWGGGLVIALIVYSLFLVKNLSKKINPKVFISSWLLAHLTVVTVGGTSTPFLMVGIGPAVGIIIALYLGDLLNKKYFLFVFGILALITFSNLTMIFNQDKNGSTLFSIQKDMILSNELNAVDYTYKVSDGKQFSINTLTSPLWVNIVWSYLYKWYGEPKFGTLPTWHGRGQEGQVISLSSDNNNWKLGFLIIEPQDGIPAQYLPQTLNQEDSYSKLISEQDFAAIRVQERTKNVK